MSINSLGLDAFFVTSRLGSFTRAAKSLSITQSALSQRILNLEEELQATLFLRERSGLRLTESGEALLRYCQTKEDFEAELLGNIRQPDQSSARGLSGSIRIAGFSTVMRSVALPSLAPLLEKNPELDLNMSIRELRELPEMVRTGEAGYLLLDQKPEREDIDSVLLGHELNVQIRAKGARNRNPRFLDHDPDDQITLRYLRLAARNTRSKTSRSKPRRRYLDDVYGLIDGVRLGLGSAVVPLHLVRSDPTLEIIDPSIVLKTPVYLWHYRQPYYSRLHQELVQTLTSRAGAFLMGSEDANSPNPKRRT